MAKNNVEPSRSKLSVLYRKCMRCTAMEDVGGPVSGADLQLATMIMAQQAGVGVNPMVTIHHCADGQVGVFLVVGSRELTARDLEAFRASEKR